MTRLSSRPARSRLLALLLAIGLAACGKPDPGSLLASARDYLAKGDHRAAIIQLRNARQEAPDNAEIRFLLGRALVDNGEAAAAEAEFRKAVDLGYPAEAVAPLLAQTVVAQDHFRRATTEFAQTRLSDPKAAADLSTSLGVAYLGDGDVKRARTAIDAALAADPLNIRAQVARARLQLRDGDSAGALATLDRALATAPNHPEATAIKADVLAASGRRGEAIALLDKSIAAQPLAMPTRYVLVSQLVAAGELDKADATVAAMKKDAPDDFRTVFSEALTAVARGDAVKARDLTVPLLKTRPDHVPSLYVAALANFRLKNYAAAIDGLNLVLGRLPNDPGPRRHLVAAYLRSGRIAQATEAADVALKRSPDDVDLLKLAGEARILSGNLAEAQRYYERAAAREKADSEARLRLAQIRLATGDSARALADLERLASADATRTQADLALFGARLGQRDYAKALASVDAIEKKEPGSAQPYELRGMVAAARRDLPGARAAYAKALEIDPTRLSSARSLAMLDLAEGKPGDAKVRYEKLIAADPKSEEPLVALAEVLSLSGAPASEVKAALERAIAVDPRAAGPRLALVAYQRNTGDAKAALDTARAGVAALPAEPRLVEALGVLQLAAGEAAQARETFLRLAQLLPQSPAPLLRMAEASIATRDFVSALDAQRRALTLQPDHLQTLVALASTYLVAGQPDDAIAEARRLQRERPKVALGFALEGELLAAQKKYPEASAAVQQALARQPLPALAIRQVALLNAAGKPGEARAFADRWVREHPKDAGFLMLLGQYREGSNDASGAIAAYRAALELEPDNAAVLNNLAWLLQEQGRPEARELAERAYRLAPINPSVIDTLGWTLVHQGETQRGISLLRMAANLQPNDGRIRIHLAQALAKGGDKAAARRELELVISRDSRAPTKAEAEKLLRAL